MTGPPPGAGEHPGLAEPVSDAVGEPAPASPAGRRAGRAPGPEISLLAGLVVGAIALRPQIVGAAPLFPAMQDDLKTSHAVIGLLGTIPVLCMGLFAPPAAWVASRLGARRAMGASILAVGVFGLLRVLPSEPWLIVVLTWPVGIGMGIAGAIAPVAIKERLGHRSAVGTGAYTSGIQTGAFMAAVTAVPLAQLFGGWRVALGVFSVVSILLAALWFALVPTVPERGLRMRPPKLPWRSETAWLLVVMFSFMALTYYGVNAWLPDVYVERGWSESAAGALLAVSNAMAIPASFAVPWLLLRARRRQPVLLATSGVFLVAVVLLLTVPAGAWVWTVVFGCSQGGMLALSLTLPLDFESSPEGVGALVAMQLGIGYTVGAAAPFALGGLRDLTGSYGAVLWTVAAFAALLFVCVTLLPSVRRRSALSG